MNKKTFLKGKLTFSAKKKKNTVDLYNTVNLYVKVKKKYWYCKLDNDTENSSNTFEMTFFPLTYES